MLIGGDLPVARLGFGTMRLTGPGIWGEPADRAGAVRVLRRAVELGVNLVDTADSYGPYVSESLVAEALHPYPPELVISTKGGLTRQGPDQWKAVGRPEYLRQCVEMSLRRLRLDRIDLYHLHRIDPSVPLEDQLGELASLRAEGKIRHIGLSEVTLDDLHAARRVVEVASVQNIYNLTRQRYRDTLEYCTREEIGFIPFFPLGRGDLTRPGGELDSLARSRGVSPAQLALAWLLHLSPAVLPIPGTTRVGHLEENLGAAQLSLTPDEVKGLTERWSDVPAVG
ncbi:aldo/keto reductase [Microtetraspora fusca]|uniref:aldo/keto reductase n=1 Tax=Microtetraspora fusca TaxID=1997 RepID=UPI001C3F21E9|nr:aldo/keto reductase [Microtetraspora fusca]